MYVMKCLGIIKILPTGLSWGGYRYYLSFGFVSLSQDDQTDSRGIKGTKLERHLPLNKVKLAEAGMTTGSLDMAKVEDSDPVIKKVPNPLKPRAEFGLKLR